MADEVGEATADHRIRAGQDVNDRSCCCCIPKMHFMNMPFITTNARIVMPTLHTRGSASPSLYLYTMMPSSFLLPSSFRPSAELNA